MWGTIQGQQEPAVTVGERISAPKLVAIPQPKLSDVEADVKEQIEAASSALQATSQKSDVSQEQLAEAYGRMGEIYHVYDFADAAVACYKNACALAPREFAWPYYLGRLYQEQRGIENSISYLKIAQELRPKDLPVLINLGNAYFIDDQLEAAKTLFEKALQLDNSQAAAEAGLGRIALSERDYVTAIRSLEKALKLQPQATSLHYPLALAYRGTHDMTRAAAHLQAQGPGKPEVADPLMEELQGLKRTQMTLWVRGNRAMEEGRYADAVTVYGQMVASAKDDPLPRIYLGTALALEGDLQGAIAQYQLILRLTPGNARVHYNLAVIYLQLSSMPEAIENFRAAVTYDPSSKLAHFHLANLLMRSGNYQESIPLYARVVELSPENGFARLMVSMALIRVRRFSEAKTALEEGTVALPENTDLASTLARLLAACPDRAIRDGPRALRLTEKLLKDQTSPDLDLVKTYAMALASMGRFREAADLQGRLIAEVESAKRFDLASELKEDFKLYERGQVCTLPWRDDDPIFTPQLGKLNLLAPKGNHGLAGKAPACPRHPD